MKMEDGNIGKFFRDQLKDVEVQPDAKVWSGIQLQAGISPLTVGVSKVLIVGAIIMLLALSSYFVWDYYSDDSIEQNTIVEHNIEPVDVPVKYSDTSNQNILITEQTTETKTEAQENPKSKRTPKSITKTKEKSEIKTDTEDKIGHVELKSDSNNTVRNSVSSIASNNEAKPEIVVSNEEEIVEEEVNAVSESPYELEEPLINLQDTINIRFSADPIICFGEDAILQVEGGVSYDWNTGARSSKIKVSSVENSSYWVIVTDDLGRQIKHTFNVSIDRECTAVFIPSAFTPNGDGVNDVFKAEGLGITNFEMIIFNREGQTVFESHSIEDAWDGTYRNSVSEARIYFYHLSYTDAKGNNHKKRGQITLIR